MLRNAKDIVTVSNTVLSAQQSVSYKPYHLILGRKQNTFFSMCQTIPLRYTHAKMCAHTQTKIKGVLSTYINSLLQHPQQITVVLCDVLLGMYSLFALSALIPLN